MRNTVVVLEAAGDVLVAEENLVEGLLRRGDEEDKLGLGARPLSIDTTATQLYYCVPMVPPLTASGNLPPGVHRAT